MMIMYTYIRHVTLMYRLLIIAYINLTEVTSLYHGRKTTVSNCPTFSGQPGACTDNVYQAFSQQPSEHEQR